jgi:hypothetical protein
MDRTNLDPAKITRPIQLSAAWFFTLVILDGILLHAAASISEPPWAAGVLVAAAIAITILVGVAVFSLQTRFREQQMDDPYYADLLKRRRREFRDFSPEAVFVPSSELTAEVATTFLAGSSEAETKAANEFDEKSFARVGRSEHPSRDEIYKLHRGLFLIHSWRPSTVPGQVADIVVRLFHHPNGKVPKGWIENVEYDLGRHWPQSPWLRTNEDDDFRLEVSAYGSALCVATVHFADDKDPLLLYRYLDLS